MQRPPARQIITAIVFVAALAIAAYFLIALSRRGPLPQVSYLAADKSYGVTVDLTQYDSPTLPATLAALQQNNLLWLRQPVRWSEIEPAPGQFNWQALDRIVNAVALQNEFANGNNQPPFKLIAVLVDAPAWARPPHTAATAPPKNLSDFGRFARQLAQRYGDRLDYYQIWHEPNLSTGWGNGFVDPDAYARLLREAAVNIRQADADALILTAALAPTRESGPLNLNEMDFLAGLYQANAEAWFDIVAGQPYGFDFDATASPNPDRLNFRRLELLRRVMLAHDDVATPIWATAAGYNALPADWAGRPSPWRDDPTKIDSPELQSERTATAIGLARRQWPWLGPLLAVRWDGVGLPADDPARGFALSETPLLIPFHTAAAEPPLATVGRYPASHPSGHFSPGWRTATTLADPPRQTPRTLVINFEGSRLDLEINRGAYRGYLWVMVDGQPANALPQDGQGRSYVTLYDPLRRPATVTLAHSLPPGRHQATLEVEGGWERWPLAGWVVSDQPGDSHAEAGLLLAALLAAVSGGWLVWQRRKMKIASPPPVAGATPSPAAGEDWGGGYLSGERTQIALVFALALAFYFAPARLAPLLLLPLALALLYRPDLALALVAVSLSFFQAPPAFVSLTETPLLLATIGLGLRAVGGWRPRLRLQSLDGAALALLGVGLLSTLFASNFGINMDGWRRLILGAVGFYFLVRLGLDFGPEAEDAPQRWVWRLVDALVAGAMLHAAVALWGYFVEGQFAAAEGTARLLSPFYASPNNLALFLGRVLPILLAVALLSGPVKILKVRRWLYGLGAVIVGVALLLTFSRGALLLGLPASLLTMGLLYGLRFPAHRRRLLGAAIGAGAVLLTALGVISQTRGLQPLAALSPGSPGFFRLKLWQSSLAMLNENWLLGSGPGNFLYLYRTRYILPSAWQEPNLSHPHNFLLDFGVRLGLAGLLVLLWLQLAFWRQGWRLYRRWPAPLLLGLMGSMAAFLSHGLIDNAYFLVDLAFVFFLTVGLVQGVSDSNVRDA